MSATVATRRPGAIRRFMRGPAARASVAYLVVLAVVGVLAPWVTPYDPDVQDFMSVMAAPSASHWLGTDDLGRDVLSRLMAGAGPSLFGSVLAVAVGAGLGIPVGLVTGYAGGLLDAAVSRVLDALLSFPGIILAIGIAGVFGPNLTNGMIAVGILMAPSFARLTRASTLVVRRELYVEAARAFGATPVRMVLHHVLPNALQPALVNAGLLLAVGLLAETSLSYLGLGIQPPQASWGGMLARAYTYMEAAPEQMYAPGLAIVVTALAFNGLGEAIRSTFDLHGRDG